MPQRTMITFFAAAAFLVAAPGAHALGLGEYEGVWLNETFGSTDDAFASITMTGPTSVEVSLDLEGNVFGGSDPSPLVLLGTINPDSSIAFADVMGHPTYGDVSNIAINAVGSVTASGTNVPNAGIQSFVMGGEVVSDDIIRLTYLVNFPTGGNAVGRIDLDRIPEPASFVMIGIGALAMFKRRRRSV